MLRTVFQLILTLTTIIIMLSVSYAVENTLTTDTLTFKNSDGEIIQSFTIRELQELFPQKSYQADPPPGNGIVSMFRGPRVKDIFSKLALSGGNGFQLIAHDNYTAKISYEEIQIHDPIFAIETECTKQDYASNICHKNQQFKLLTEKGPIRMIWPFNQFSSVSAPLANPAWIYSVRIVQQL